MSQKIDDMRDMLHIMRQNIEELQKIHNINKSANLAKADSIYELKNKGDYSKRETKYSILIFRIEQLKTRRRKQQMAW